MSFAKCVKKFKTFSARKLQSMYVTTNKHDNQCEFCSLKVPKIKDFTEGLFGFAAIAVGE